VLYVSSIRFLFLYIRYHRLILLNHIYHFVLVYVVRQFGRFLRNQYFVFVLNFCSSEKSFVKLTCKFRPKKIGLYSENVILTIKRRNNFKTTITLTGRCMLGNLNTILHDSIENEVRKKERNEFIFNFILGIVICLYWLCYLIHNNNMLFFIHIQI
jgi:hypothetical protein